MARTLSNSYTSVVRGIVDLLGNTPGQSMVPLDIMSLIVKGLKKVTTTDFTVHVTALMTAHETHICEMHDIRGLSCGG